ncbi:MAG: hypothetical protein LBQ27_00540 [Clostridiales bacterium]|nr:hypothetical protein [Clostridiales bacterium]
MENAQENLIVQTAKAADIEIRQKCYSKNLYTRFNNALDYYLKNTMKLIWVLTKFFVFVTGVCLIASPFIIFGMSIISPDSAVKFVKALGEILETLINVFR